MNTTDAGAGYLLVDGHSLIHGDPGWRGLHGRTPRMARDEVASALRRLQDATGERVVLVFDGRGRTAVEPRRPHDIQVIYAGSDETADAVIERLVARYAQRFRLTVATDDRAEQLTVSAFGAADVISTRHLLARLEATDRELGDRLVRLRREAGGAAGGSGFGVRA